MKKEKMDPKEKKEMINFFLYLPVLPLVMHDLFLGESGVSGLLNEILDVVVLLIFSGFCIHKIVKSKERTQKAFLAVALIVCLSASGYLGHIITADLVEGPVTDTFYGIDTGLPSGRKIIRYYMEGIGDVYSYERFPIDGNQWHEYKDSSPLQITFYPRMNRIWKIEEL